MQIIQYQHDGRRAVGVVDGDTVLRVDSATSVLNLSLSALAHARSLDSEVKARGIAGTGHRLDDLLSAGSVLPPLDHPDPAHLMVSGTGLTHIGSASARDRMHRKEAASQPVTDTQKMFELGIHGGRPETGKVGVQPEWFYKGDGAIVVPPGGDLPWPSFGEDLGEEPEIVGLYVIDGKGVPWRIGYALGNEVSDHVMEKRNYLYLAHSKLRHCSFGPALVTGELPDAITGISRVLRNGQVLWERRFASGEANMCHSLSNLGYHHFKYPQFRRPGDVHAHFFGAATLSFNDGISPRVGDTFEIASPYFGAALRNTLAGELGPPLPPGGVRSL